MEVENETWAFLSTKTTIIIMWSDIWNVSYIELRIWNQVSHDHRSYERNLSNCVEKPEKVRTSTWFEPVTSRYRCDALTNWAMKPLTVGAGHLWVLMSLWRMDVKWYMKCFIYWTAAYLIIIIMINIIILVSLACKQVSSFLHHV